MDYTSLKNFIIGMRYHDIAKSLWFSAKDHTVNGYYILKNSSFDENVAINSLLHHEHFFDDNFYAYTDNINRKLPFSITFSEYIDRLSSVAMGTEPENISNYPISAQNLFSRLPVIFKEKISLKAIGNSESAEPLSRLLLEEFKKEYNLAEQLVDTLDYKLYDDLINNGKVQITEKVLTKLEDEINTEELEKLKDLLNKEFTIEELEVNLKNLKFADEKIKVILIHAKNNLLYLLDDYMKISPQRSYPPDNDVNLYYHNVLAAVMAMLICCNMKKNNTDAGPLTITIGKRFNLQKVDPSLINNSLRENLKSRIVRINFTGFEELFSESKEINDFLGVQSMIMELKKRFKEKFSYNLLRKIGWKIISEDPYLIYPLNEFPFDLIYLLPEVEKSDIEAIVLKNYKEIFYKLIKEVMLTQKINICPKDSVNIPYISIVDFEILLDENEIGTTEQMIKSYSLKLTDVYERSISEGSLSGIVPDIIPPKNIADFNICNVCQRNHVIEEFNDIKASLPEGLCDEQEKLCLFCIAQRIKSYEYKATDEFLNMVTVETKSPDEILFTLNTSKPLPPKAILKAKGKDGELVDMGIMFVRHKKVYNRAYTKVFPTINYSADKDSNIALIEFYPDMNSLLDNYDYNLEKIKPVGSLFNLIDDNYIKKALEELSSKAKEYLTKLGYKENEKNLPLNPEKELNLSDFYNFNPHEHLKSLIEDIKFLLKKYKEIYNICNEKDVIKEIIAHIQHESEKFKKKITNDLKCLDALVKFDERKLNKENFSNLKNGKLEPKSKSLSYLLDNFIRLDEYVDIKPTGFLDRHNFMKYYAYVSACYYRRDYEKGLKPNKLKECQSVPAYMGRVLSRINWIENFYKKFYEELKKENIAGLPIEKNYPRALFTVPANQLDKVLTVFHKMVAKELFSFSYKYYEEHEKFRKDYFDFIEDILPPVLYMAVTVFKCKQPIAIVMETSKNIIKTLAEEAKTWHGVKTGFVDMRGSFNPFGLVDAKADFVELIKVLDIVKELPRGVILNTYSEDEKYRDASLKIQAKKHGWSEETFDIAKKNFDLLWLLKKVMKE